MAKAVARPAVAARGHALALMLVLVAVQMPALVAFPACAGAVRASALGGALDAARASLRSSLSCESA